MISYKGLQVTASRVVGPFRYHPSHDHGQQLGGLLPQPVQRPIPHCCYRGGTKHKDAIAITGLLVDGGAGTETQGPSRGCLHHATVRTLVRCVRKAPRSPKAAVKVAADDLVDTYVQLWQLYARASFFLMMDGNVHFDYYLGLCHGDCTCLHCCQPRHDFLIQSLVEEASLFACNPPIPTHDSGSCVPHMTGEF